MTLEQMKNVDITTVDRSTLIDIRTVRTDSTLPETERKRDYISKIRNPYCFLVGDVIVKLSFDDSAPTITDRLESVLAKI